MSYSDVKEFLAKENNLSEVSFNKWTNGNGLYYRLTKLGFHPIVERERERGLREKIEKIDFIAGIFIGMIIGLTAAYIFTLK